MNGERFAIVLTEQKTKPQYVTGEPIAHLSEQTLMGHLQEALKAVHNAEVRCDAVVRAEQRLHAAVWILVRSNEMRCIECGGQGNVERVGNGAELFVHTCARCAEANPEPDAKFLGDTGLRQIEPDDRSEEPVEFTETDEGYEARENWARAHDELNGAPEGDDDR